MYLSIITISLLGSIAFGFLSRESEVCRLKLLLLYFLLYIFLAIVCGFAYWAYLVWPSLKYFYSINLILNIIYLFISLFSSYVLYTVYYKSNKIFNKDNKKKICDFLLLNPFVSNNEILEEDISIFSSYNLKSWILSSIFIMVFILGISYLNSIYLVPAVKFLPHYVQLGFLAFGLGLVLLLIYKFKLFHFFNKINLLNKSLLFLYILSLRFILIFIATEFLCLFDSELSELILLILTTESFFFLFKSVLYEYVGLFSNILANSFKSLNINFQELCGFIPNMKQFIIDYISYKYINIRMRPFCTRIIGATKLPISIELGVLSIINKPYFPSFFQPLSLPIVCPSVSTIMLANIFKSPVLTTMFVDSLYIYITTGKISRALEIVLDLVLINKSKFNFSMSSQTNFWTEFKSNIYKQNCTSLIIKGSYNSIYMDLKRLDLYSFVKNLHSIQLLEKYVNVGIINDIISGFVFEDNNFNDILPVNANVRNSLRSSVSIYSYMFLGAIFFSLPVGVLASNELYYIADKPWVLTSRLVTVCGNTIGLEMDAYKTCISTSTSISTSITTVTSISIITSVVSITNVIDRSLSSIILPTITKTITNSLPTATVVSTESAKSLNVNSQQGHFIGCIAALIISIVIQHLWGTSSTPSTSSVVETDTKKKKKKILKKEANIRNNTFIDYLKGDFKLDLKGSLRISVLVFQAIFIGIIVNIYCGWTGLV